MKWILSLVSVLALLFTLIINNWESPESVCKSSSRDTSYCRYKGVIEEIYVNSDQLLLLKLKSDFGKESAKIIGYEVSSGRHMALDLTREENKAMFSLVLSAFESNRSVELHARGLTKSYLTIDRIWVR